MEILHWRSIEKYIFMLILVYYLYISDFYLYVRKEIARRLFVSSHNDRSQSVACILIPWFYV